MRRRTFLGLGVAAGLVRPRAAAGLQAQAGWHFALGDDLRWSLVDTSGRTVVGPGVVTVEIAGRDPLTLGRLDQMRRMRTGPRRGDATTVIGHRNGVEVTATFTDGPAPRVAVQVRGLRDPCDLTAIRFADGLAARQTAWINGYQSWSRSAMARSGEAATGHWLLALLPGPAGAPPGLAFAFGADDAGAGEYRLEDGRLTIVSRVRHRTISMDQPPAGAVLTILPASDPLDALARHVADGARNLPAAPAGWCSWYELYTRVTEEDVLANLEILRRTVDPADAPWVQIDDGFQRAAGDWDTNVKFPHGHRWLTDRILAAGFRPGLWLAPFAVTMSSGIPYAHPEWLLQGESGDPLKTDLQPQWGGQSYALDASQAPVRDYLRELARTAVQDWGYGYLKLDFLHYGALGTRPDRDASPHEALRAGLRALREGAGSAFLLGCGAPLQHSHGYFEGMRIGSDVDASWEGIQPGVRAALLRAPLHRRAWLNDPDALVVREPMTLDEAQAWASVVALTGGMTMASDVLTKLPAERLAILQRTMPVARVRGEALDLVTPPPVPGPALLAGDRAVQRIDDGWRLKAGDHPAYADMYLDESTWRPIAVGRPWEDEGHPRLDGFAWYRVHFRAPAQAPRGDLRLALGKVDDCDETFLNGTRIGATGMMPPDYHPAWQDFRRYPVPPELVRWGGENVLAVRVYDGGGAGGLWQLVNDRPPSQVLAQVRADWWMLSVANWEDDPGRTSVNLAAHGIRGPLAVYDVWKETRLADAAGRLTLTVPPHSATVLSLRRPRTGAYILGTSRHVVQGAVDLADERWEARTRTLRGRSVRLDGRPYVVMIAVPPGMHPTRCEGDGACTIEHAHSNARIARLTFAQPKREIEWEVGF